MANKPAIAGRVLESRVGYLCHEYHLASGTGCTHNAFVLALIVVFRALADAPVAGGTCWTRVATPACGNSKHIVGQFVNPQAWQRTQFNQPSLAVHKRQLEELCQPLAPVPPVVPYTTIGCVTQ